jgi:hypothetical protein
MGLLFVDVQVNTICVHFYLSSTVCMYTSLVPTVS